jgi:hypothetical protein
MSPIIHKRIVEHWKDIATREKHVDVFTLCRLNKSTPKMVENSSPFDELVTCKHCIRIMNWQKENDL